MRTGRVYTAIALVGIALAAAAGWWWQHRSPAAGVGGGSAMLATAGRAGPAGGPAMVEAGRVEIRRLEDDAQAVGSLRSRQGVMLRPEVSGRVSALNFRDGQPVRRGQVLVQLDDTLQAAQLQQAQAQASIARTNLQRNRDLVAQNFVSQSAVDQSAAALQVADAQVALAQAQLQRMKVLAPFDGVAGIRQINVGDYLKDGADIVGVEDVGALWVDFRLPERFIARLKPGQLVEVSLDAMPGERLNAQVDALDALLDANGRSLLVRARLDNPRGVLKSGMFARTRIVFAAREHALVVPEEALVPLGGKQYLVKLVDGPQGKVSQRLEAQIGLRLPGRAEILRGLAEGDLVVTAGQAALLKGRDALPVRVVNLGASGAASAPAVGAGALPGEGAHDGAAGGASPAASAPRPPPA